MYFLLKLGIFHCYVSLPEGTTYINDNFLFLNTATWRYPFFLCHFDRTFLVAWNDEATGKLFHKHRGTCKSTRLLWWNFDRIFQLQRCFRAHGQSCWTKPSRHWSHLSLLNKCHLPQRRCRDGCETCGFVLCCGSGCCESICWTQIGTSCLCNAGFWISPTHGRDLSPKASKSACWCVFVVALVIALGYHLFLPNEIAPPFNLLGSFAFVSIFEDRFRFFHRLCSHGLSMNDAEQLFQMTVLGLRQLATDPDVARSGLVIFDDLAKLPGGSWERFHVFKMFQSSAVLQLDSRCILRSNITCVYVCISIVTYIHIYIYTVSYFFLLHTIWISISLFFKLRPRNE